MNPFLSLFESKPMVLIMSLPVNSRSLHDAAFRSGADAVKVHCNVHHRASGRQFPSFAAQADIFGEMLACAKGPMGIVLGDTLADVRRDLGAAAAYPFSFFSSYTHHAPPEILTQPQALMAACPAGYRLDEVACMKACGVSVLEASIMPPEGYGKPLCLQDLLAYRTLCTHAAIPVVVPTQRAIRPEDVRHLHDIGVRGLMIGAIVTGTETPEIQRSVERYRDAIDRL